MKKNCPERNQVVNEDVKRLESNGLIREVQYPKWLDDVMVVRKKNDKTRVCIDFTDLNEAGLKDSFLLPMIDILVDAMAGHQLMSFMDVYSRYNQILMHSDDQEKTSFMI